MDNLSTILMLAGFVLSFCCAINAIIGKSSKKLWYGMIAAYIGFGVCYAASQRDGRDIGIAFMLICFCYIVKVIWGFLKAIIKHEKYHAKMDLIALAVTFALFIVGMMLPYDKTAAAERAAESEARAIEKTASSAASASSKAEEEGQKQAESEEAASREVESQSVAEEVTSQAVADSKKAKDDSKDVESFLRRNKEVSETFAKNLKATLPLAGLDYTLDDVNWFEQTGDWAAGSRYNAQIDGKIYIQIATIGDEIYSIKDTKNGATDNFLYKNENLKPDAGEVPDNSILLTDGELGDYGENAKTKSGYEYVRYNVPAGNYRVENKAKQSSVFVVSNSNSDDVSASLQLTANGEKANLTVKSGYHIELSMYAQILLTPVQ